MWVICMEKRIYYFLFCAFCKWTASYFNTICWVVSPLPMIWNATFIIFWIPLYSLDCPWSLHSVLWIWLSIPAPYHDVLISIASQCYFDICYDKTFVLSFKDCLSYLVCVFICFNFFLVSSCPIPCKFHLVFFFFRD